MDKIATLLQGTLSSTKQIRLESENELEILGAQNGFMEQLLLINSKTSLIYLKNLLKRYPSRRNNDFKAILFVLLQKKHQTGSAENFDLIIDCFILMAEQEDILTCLQENMLRVVESYCRMNAYNDDIKIIAENLQLVRPKMSNRDEIKSMLKIFYFCSRQRIDVNLYIAVVIPFMSIEDLNIKKWVMKVLNRYSNSNSLNAGQLFQHYVTLFDIDNVKIKELILSFVIRHSTTLLPFMNQYKDEIFYKLIMPLMRFNDKGIEEWLDQREFIVNYIGRNFRICFDALETLCKNKEMYDCTLNYLATHQVVDDYDLFGYISCALPIADRFLQSEPLAEQFLIARIFPCLDSTSQGYNRAMAFFCCSKYSRIHYMDKKNLELLFLKVIGALGDKYTAVKMCALLVIPQFIKYPEGISY